MREFRHRSYRGSAAALAALGLSASFLATGVGLRAQTGNGKSAAPSSAAQDKFVDITGQTYRSKQTADGTISTISGNVEFRYEDSLLKTDSATYNQRTQIAVSPGKVQVDDPQNTIVGSQGIAYYKTRNAEITGDVHITVRPKDQDRNAPEGSLRREFKDPAVITCDKVIYNWRTRVANATGNLTLKQTDRTVTAEKAIFEGRLEKVTLTGNVRGVNTKGEEVRAEKAIVILTEGAESLELINVKNIKIWVDPEETKDLPPAQESPTEPAAPPSGEKPAPPGDKPSGGGTTPPAPPTPPAAPSGGPAKPKE